MKDFLASLAGALAALEANDQRRSLAVGRGIDFASNDYLGLAADADLLDGSRARRAAADAAGAPASRLLRGHTALHARLEARLAALKGTERALLFPSGYQANLGTLSALVRPGDRVVSDAFNHASLIDGVRLARCAKTILPHGDLKALDAALATPHPGRTFVVVESLYSMDGDHAPLDQIADRCARHDALLMVDDAHATGLFGATGGGLVEAFGVAQACVAITSTLGKAFGLAGAFVAGPAVVIDTLINRSRAFLFTTAPPPVLLHAIDVALDLAAAQPERRKRVRARADRLRQQLRHHGISLPAGRGPIVPVVIGDAADALAVADAVVARGFDVRAVRPPTVPAGTCRLRLSVHADHDEATIDALAAAVAEAMKTRAIVQPTTVAAQLATHDEALAPVAATP